MKALKTASLVFLVVLFIGIAGGFTKSETRHHDPCEQYSVETEYDEWHDCLDDIYYSEENCDTFEKIFDEKNDCEPVTAWLTDETWSYQKIVFDPKSTALFVIVGAIIALVGLEMRKKKEGN